MPLDRDARLGPYEIVGLLGAGGMGEVYHARDSRLGRDLAIKVLAPSLAQDASALARFEREAKTASSLNHPNIVHIYEIGEAATASGPVHYIAMEYIEGQTLRARLKAGERWKSLLEPLTSVAEALAKAHKAGIVHRDLKPENVMITGDGYPKVVDFGLAKLIEGAAPPVNDMTAAEPDLRTGTGTLLGTPSYMSPEQAQGKPADHRSDIFSFGCILYEAATGRRTFAADSAVATLHAIVYEAPPAVESLSADAPAPLHGIVNKCLAKDPAQRYQSTADLVSDLRALARPTVTPNPDAVPTMALSQLSRSAITRGHSRRWLALAAMAAVVVAGAWFWRSKSVAVPPRSPDAALQVEKVTNRGTVGSIALSSDGVYLAYSALDGKRTIWLRNLAEKTETRLVAPFESSIFGGLWFAPDGQSLRYSFIPTGSEEWSTYSVPLIGGGPRLVVATTGNLSPDGRRFAQVRRHEAGWRLFVSDLETGQEKDLGEVDRWSRASWSPDGARLLFRSGKDDKTTLLVAAIDGKGARQVAEVARLRYIWWKPKGEGALLALDVDKDAWVRLHDLDLSTGRVRALGDRVWQNITGVSWLPDAAGLVVNEQKRGEPGTLWLVSYPDGRTTRIAAGNQNYRDMDLSGDGATLASVQSVGRSAILVSSDPDRGQFTTIEKGTDVEHRPRWLTDGRIVFGANDAGTYDLYLADADGSNRTQLTFDRAGNESDPAVSPDGRYIVFVSDRSGEKGIYRINRDGTGLMPLTPPPTPGHGDRDPVVTPDSQWVLYRHWDNGPSQWKIPIAGGTPVLVRGGTAGPLLERAYGASASPDGRLLAYFYFTEDVKSLAFSRMEIVVASSDGTITKRFPYNDTIVIGDNRRIQWSPDGRSLYYNGGRAGPNLWKQSLAGGPAVQITHFEEPLNYFDWSPDGKKLLVSRESTLSDAVLITNFH